MPTEGKNHIIFKNHENRMPVPFVIYADFESIIKPKTENAGDKSEITSEHEACGFGYQVVRFDGAAKAPVTYRWENAVEVCEVSGINNIFAHPKPLTMKEQDNIAFEKATHCWICEKEQDNFKNNPKVRDHCHFTGQYRGPAHKSCNLKLKIKPGITKTQPQRISQPPHNAIDSHHKGKHYCIPNNAEKNISFSVGQLKFLNSLQFMAKLVDATDKDDFKITQNSFNPQPIKKRLYGSMGSEDCRPIILRECIDKQKLAYLLEHHNQFELGTNFRDGQKSDKETQLSLLRIYLSMLNQNGERLMPNKQRNGFGRYRTAEKLGIQNMSRKIRHTICKDSMFDIDMKNAHPTPLSWYCHKHKIKCEPLDKYIKSREPMLQDLMNCRRITRDKAKKTFISYNEWEANKSVDR